MELRSLGAMRPVVAVGGAALVASAFMTWAETAGRGESALSDQTGLAILALFTGAVALLAAATDGRIGLFRPDVSVGGAADVLSVATAAAIGAFLLAGLPEGAEASAGAFVAIIAATVTACACADWRVLRGAPVFPRGGSSG